MARRGTPFNDPVFCASLGGIEPYETDGQFNDGLVSDEG